MPGDIDATIESQLERLRDCCSRSALPREHRPPQLHRARPERGSVSRRRTRRRGDRPRRRGERAGGRGGRGVRDRRRAPRPRPCSRRGRRVPRPAHAADAARRACRGSGPAPRSSRPAARSMAPVGEGLLGRVLDGLGRPIDGKGPLPPGVRFEPIDGRPPSPLGRPPIERRLALGVRALDARDPVRARPAARHLRRLRRRQVDAARHDRAQHARPTST